MNVDQRQTAANPQTRPTDLNCESAIHHRHLLLLSPKADTGTHFTVPRSTWNAWCTKVSVKTLHHLRSVLLQKSIKIHRVQTNETNKIAPRKNIAYTLKSCQFFTPLGLLLVKN